MSLIYEFKLDTAIYRVYNEKPKFDFQEVKQVHGNHIAYPDNSLIEADGIIGLSNNTTPLAIKTADCLAIGVVGKKGHANLHAGWRGLAQNIFANKTLKSIGPTHFLIAPAIEQKDYEVGDEFLEHFAHFPNSFSRQFKKLTFSLQKTAIELIKSEFKNANIVLSNINTYDHESLHSYRRDHTVKRNWNVLVPSS